MERNDAVEKIRQLVGTDLRKLADRYGVTVWRGDKKNKGWAGHVIERYLGLPLNSAQAPNFGSWELKLVSLKRLKREPVITAKETMQITMVDPVYVAATKFEDSHVFAKLNKMVVCARLWESSEELSSILVDVTTFGLDDPDIYEQARQDYELIRETIRTQGFDAVHSAMGVLIQARTKGAGHGTTSRAFYARTCLVKLIFDLPRTWE